MIPMMLIEKLQDADRMILLELLKKLQQDHPDAYETIVETLDI